MSKAKSIGLQVVWNRLLAVVEEQAQALVRAAFSTSTREAGDVSAGIFDVKGRMLAQAMTGTPGHINAMALSVPHFLAKFPIETMREGDVFITNDPWKGTGHLHDFSVVTPVFRRGKMVALFACTSHVVDIGGLGMTPDGRQVFHEGLFVPITHFARQGEVNEFLLEMVRANVREPVQVEGDIYALAACNEIGARRLDALMTESGIESLDEVGDYIIEMSRAAMLKAIRALPQGSARWSMTIDGFDKPIDLVATVTIGPDGIAVDYDGTSPSSDFGINCPMCYSTAYTAFGVKCVVAPALPNNTGTIEVVTVTAPEGTIVNAPYPCAVVSRGVVGQMLPDVVFGCLHQLLPGRVPAEGTSGNWNVRLGAGHGISERPSNPDFKATAFQVQSFHSGGVGARPTKDGLSATPFPSGVKSMPVEISEAISPVVFWRKEYVPDSGGAGTWRGGLGQVMEIGNREPASFALFSAFDRTQYPARGRDGGKPGALGEVSLTSGPRLQSKGRQTIPEGDRLIMRMPGGGGYGDPLARDVAHVRADVVGGYVTREAALAEYGVVLTDDLAVDAEATARRRSCPSAS